MTLQSRRMKRLCKTAWFQDFLDEDKEEKEDEWRGFQEAGQPPRKRRKGEKGQPLVESVMFVPFTEGSSLKKELTEQEAKMPYQTKIKFVESMGMTVGDTLFKKDPTSGHCQREDCFLCMSQPGKCMRQGLVYEIRCKTCEKEGKDTAYVGETARTGYDRGVEW